MKKVSPPIGYDELTVASLENISYLENLETIISTSKKNNKEMSKEMYVPMNNILSNMNRISKLYYNLDPLAAPPDKGGAGVE